VTRLRDLLARDWSLKLTALALAVLLWIAVRGGEPVRLTLPDVPVHVALHDAGWVPAAPPAPATVRVTFSGPLRELARLAVDPPRIVVPVDEVRDTVELRPLRPAWVRLDARFRRVRAETLEPAAVRLFFAPAGRAPAGPAARGAAPARPSSRAGRSRAPLAAGPGA